MEDLKELFGDGSLSYEEFSQKLGEAKDIKLANLKSGNYVDKAKYEKLENSVNEWQTKYSALSESTKGYAELQTNYDDLKTNYDKLIAKQDEDTKMGLINNANVNPKFAKFIYTEVSALVDDKKDFQTALDEYLKDNKEFLKGKTSTYVELEKGGAKPETFNEKVNKFIRSKI